MVPAHQFVGRRAIAQETQTAIRLRHHAQRAANGRAMPFRAFMLADPFRARAFAGVCPGGVGEIILALMRRARQ